MVVACGLRLTGPSMMGNGMTAGKVAKASTLGPTATSTRASGKTIVATAEASTPNPTDKNTRENGKTTRDMDTASRRIRMATSTLDDLLKTNEVVVVK